MGKFDFRNLIKRINGVSTPIFGVSWNPSNSDRDIARKMVYFLEDKRALYYPYGMEIPYQVNESVLQIRQHLTDILQSVDDKSQLIPRLKAMRAACRKYLDEHPTADKRRRKMHHYDMTLLGELRGVFGVNIAEICLMYGIDMDTELVEILPIEDSD